MVGTLDPSVQTSVHLLEVDQAGVRQREIDMASIEAAFFVHDLGVWRQFRLPERFGPAEVEVEPLDGERKVDLLLEWGERLYGIIRPRDGRWYDFVPLGPDRAGNLVRALISEEAIAEMREINEASAERE